MQFSILKEKITPHIPVLQAGFASRSRKSEGVHDNPYATVVLIKANKTVVIIALDLLYGDRSFANGIKEAIHEKYGIMQDEIIINYSHTHSVVAVTGEDLESRSERPYSMNSDKFLWGQDKRDIDYTEDVKYFHMVRAKILNMIEEGLKNLSHGEAFICKGKSRFGVSRRCPHEGKILWKPNFSEDAIDTDLFLIKFVDGDNNIKGLIYNYACHPTTVDDNYLITADFPGAVRKHLEEQIPGMTPIFLQGCGADIKPFITACNGEFRSCDFNELEEAGVSLAKEIQTLISEEAGEHFWRKIEFNIHTQCCEVNLYTKIWKKERWEELINDPQEPAYRKASTNKILIDMKEDKIKNYLPYYISLLSLDDKTNLVALECEVVSDIGKNIKKALCNQDTIVLGYSNSSVCYIPTKEILFYGGYESEAFVNARLAGPFVDEVEDIIIGRVVLMTKNIF